MTQTSAKPANQTATNTRGTQSSTSDYIDGHAIARSDRLTPALSSSLQQAVQDSDGSKHIESQRVEHTPKRQGITLRRQLLTTILPVVLVPLTIAGVLSWYITHQRAAQQADQQLQAQALLAANAANASLKVGLKDMLAVANNPLTINAARAGAQKSEAAGLNRLPLAQVENRFAVTKLLQPDSALNSYLQNFAKISGFAEIFFTEQNGFNIAYSNPTSDFVQRDEQWWQQGKSKGRFIGETGFDESAKTFSIELIEAINDPLSGKFLGVVKGVYSTANLSKLLEQQLKDLAVVGSGQLQILDIKNKDVVLNTITAQGPIDNREVLGGKAVLQRATALAKQTQNVNTREKPDVLTTSFEHDGRRYTLAKVVATNFVSVASIDLSEIRSASNQLAFLFIGIFLVLGVVIVAIIQILTHRLSAPLSDLTAKAEQVSLGNLDVYAEPLGTAETQTLAQGFNNLTARVKDLLQKQEEAAHQQLAIQEEIARQQAENAEQQRLAKEQLQQRAVELLAEVDPVSKGDLTVRASVTEDEIGTIADSYNATVGSLRQIVTQVQATAKQVATTTSSSEVSVQELSAEALRQAQEIAVALDRIQEMSNSIRTIAANAEQAEVAVKQATQTVEEGDTAMNRTVDGILAIRETVAETSKKVKQLGESSQKISKVVNLIGTFAAQTNLLALKASIEAARAGEEGRGFAVLANEVRALAGQSAQATAEIESMVTDIQTETNEVVAAMEAGTLQVFTGTRLVDETRQSLNKIAATSTQISTLVSAIASDAVAQSQASESVTQTMSDVAAIAQQTSTEATLVSASFKELLAMATELQASVGQFKVS